MKKCFLLLMITLLASCQSSNNHRLSDREKLVNEISHSAAQKIKQKVDLYPFGSGGQISHGVEMLALSFKYYKPIEIEEGRELLIRAMNELISAVNEDERVHKYLNNFPFEERNVQVSIFISNPDGTDVEPGKLCVMGSIKGILDYSVKCPDRRYSKEIHTETFKEAVSKLKSQKVPALKKAMGHKL